MLILRCDEATVYAAIAGVAALLSLFAALRAAVNLLSSLLSRATHRFLHPVAERSMCAVVSVVVIVFFANGSALLPALLLLATVTSGAFCHSLCSFRWLWVCCLVVYGALLLQLVGPRLWEDVDVNAEEWSALVRGQRVLVPSRAEVNAAVIRNAAPEDRPASRFLFSYYDGVRLEGSASPALADGSAPRRHVLPTEIKTWLQGTWVAQQWQQDSAGSTAHKKTKKQKGRQWKEDAVPTFHIIASGDGTVLTHYAEREVDGHVMVDTVYLVGQRSRLEHSHVHCRASSGNASLSSPCLRLHSTAALHNITIFWTNATEANGAVWQSWHTAAESALTCAEVQQQLHAHAGQEDQLDRNSSGGDANDVQAVMVASFLLECMDEFSVAQLPRPFVAAAPFPVRLAWHVPTYLHHAQEAVFVVADRIVLPLALLLADLVAICGAALSRLFGYFGAAFVEALPHVKHGAEQVAVFAGGVACGAAPRASGVGTAADAQATVLHAYAPAATRCAAFARSHAMHAAFTAGVKTRNSVVSVCSAVADAADLFPGVWTVYRWAWNAEMRITVGILKVVRAAAVFVFVVLPRPLLHVVVVVAQQLGAVVKLAGVPLRALGLWLARLPLLPYVSRLGWSLWALEARMLRYEWSLLQYVVEAVFKRGEVALEALLQLLAYLVSRGSVFMTRYGRTSFAIHLVVTVLQTLLLLTAMRNEMRELVAEERLRSPTQRSSLRFIQRLLPRGGGLTSWLPLQSISAHVNGCMLLVRAHHQACVSYLFLHAVGLLVLIGLSVLPFMGKLYGLSLRYVLPWMSAKAFLVFFEDPPRVQATVLLVVARMALATTLQHTIGDFLYKIVKDVLIGCGLMGGLTLALWAWPQRTVLAQQVATAIADSLQGTPVPTPQRLAHGVTGATGAEPGDVEGDGSAAAAAGEAPSEAEADAVNNVLSSQKRRNGHARSIRGFSFLLLLLGCFSFY